MIKKEGKLKSSENHLNDHVLHLQYHMLQFFLVDLSFCYSSIDFDQRMSKAQKNVVKLEVYIYSSIILNYPYDMWLCHFMLRLFDSTHGYFDTISH